MNKRPRRPAQIDPEQVEYLTGEPDPAQISEIAHAAAQALVPTSSRQNIDDDVRERILELLDEEGIDLVAEAWVRAPSDTLGGVLWRGYLLREWIRREPADVARRFAASQAIAEENGQELPWTPADIRERWDAVFSGAGAEGFTELLSDSGAFAGVLGDLDAVWISSDNHDLATHVTRRNDALLETAKELTLGAAAFDDGRLD
ncbi:hypothetical protein [Flaviflexus equikiangi]|uniref:Uncharacterized protein n=1 Tax=Flaviflexus equikiangi TaxID=2758573 RepID=A0ABS2TG95_9ACTO|nr:hypothetical protein [Flaviflexus equikiangi]MBM9433669.1 hypothetical protein [Flaviflexus equikiangi]